MQMALLYKQSGEMNKRRRAIGRSGGAFADPPTLLFEVGWERLFSPTKNELLLSFFLSSYLLVKYLCAVP